MTNQPNKNMLFEWEDTLIQKPIKYSEKQSKKKDSKEKMQVEWE